MTIRSNTVTAAFYGQPDLDRLASMYPAFWFSLETVGRHGSCWVARRRNGLRPGVHTVITTDLAELHAALATPEGGDHAR